MHNGKNSKRIHKGSISSGALLLLGLLAIAIAYLVVGVTDRNSSHSFGANLRSILNFLDPYSNPAYKEIVARLTEPLSDKVNIDGTTVDLTLQSDGKLLSLQFGRPEVGCLYSITPTAFESGYLEVDFEPHVRGCLNLSGRIERDGSTLTVIMLIRGKRFTQGPDPTFTFYLGD